MDHLRCVVERITYQNEENGYSVIKCRAKNYSDLVTVVGSMAEVHVGSVLTMEGFWKVDPKYGQQFSMQSYEETLPATVFGIEKDPYAFLRMHGMGRKTLQELIDRMEELGVNCDLLKYAAGFKTDRSGAEFTETHTS